MSFRDDRVLLVLIGAAVVVTALLLFVLSSWVEPMTQADLVEDSRERASSVGDLPAETFVPAIASTAAKQVTQGAPDSVPVPVPVPDPTPSAPSSFTPADPISVPPELLLSPAEISALSKEEREKYEQMLEAYQGIQVQTQRLQQERTHLQNQVDAMENRNKSLSGELENMRQLLEEAPSQQRPPSTEDGGKS